MRRVEQKARVTDGLERKVECRLRLGRRRQSLGVGVVGGYVRHLKLEARSVVDGRVLGRKMKLRAWSGLWGMFPAVRRPPGQAPWEGVPQ